MKRINNIVISNTEPSVNSLWITQNTIKWFGKSGWKGLDFTDNTKLWNAINQEISDRQEEDKHIKEQASQNADNIATLKTQVGSNNFSSSNYLSKETNVTDALLQLDEELKATNDNLTLEHEYNSATYATKEEMNQADTNLQNSIDELSNSTDEKLNNYLSLTGGTMTGGITFESGLDANEYVDLGLPSGLLWAKCNIGANSEEEVGLYFQWGDTQGYTAKQVGDGEGLKAFTWDDYKFSIDGSSSNFSKYNDSDSKTVLDPEDDAAHVIMGGNWRMPTFEEYKELCLNTDIYIVPTEGKEIQVTAKEQSGNIIMKWTPQEEGTLKGLKFYKKGDKQTYMFVLMTGLAYNGSVRSISKFSSLWSSSMLPSSVPMACHFNFNLKQGSTGTDYKYKGRPIRGVCPKSDAPKSHTENIITVSGKSDTDLLNAAGGTTAIDNLATSIPVATPSSNGTMSSTDKSKLDNIAENANNYTLPNATTSIRGGVLMAEAIADTTVDGTETVTTVATTLNSLLAALRTAGILMA